MNIRVSNEYEGDDFRNVLSFAYKKTAEQVVTEVLKKPAARMRQKRTSAWFRTVKCAG